MRTINEIIIHCTATKVGRAVSVAEIDCWHKKRGFNMIGYHFVVDLEGEVHKGRPLSIAGAHATGHNAHSIGICYVGGLDAAGRPADTRTSAQKTSLRQLVSDLLSQYPAARVLGHRDTSPDLNKNGKVDKWEWVKVCPCFDVSTEL